MTGAVICVSSPSRWAMARPVTSWRTLSSAANRFIPAIGPPAGAVWAPDTTPSRVERVFRKQFKSRVREAISAGSEGIPAFWRSWSISRRLPMAVSSCGRVVTAPQSCARCLMASLLSFNAASTSACRFTSAPTPSRILISARCCDSTTLKSAAAEADLPACSRELLRDAPGGAEEHPIA